nr:nucleotide-binding alpha-beta plait domain-containing protein [Tanacetum cinerariifolium]
MNNLCTIWVGRLKLNANVARFNRENLKSSRIVDKTAKRFNKSSHNTFHKTDGNKDIGNSFVNVVKGSGMSLEMGSTPTIVLDDECLNTKDLSCSLMGRVKESTSLSNLKKVLCNEGFDVLKISYLGELWVLIEFESAKNILESFKIVFRGKVYWMRAKEVPGWTPEFTEEEEEDDVSVEDNHGGIHSDQDINNCNDESDEEEVPETCFNVPEGQKGNPSKDPFGIYPLMNKDKNIREHKIQEEESSLKHPPGFTPVGNLNEGHLDGGCAKKVNEEVAGDDNSFVHTVGGKENSGSVNKMSDSMGSCRLKKSGMPRTGGSILSFMEEVVKETEEAMALENNKNINAEAEEAETIVPSLHSIDVENYEDEEDVAAPHDNEADDVIVIPSADEADEKPVSVIGRKRVYALIDESDSDEE